MFLVHSKRWTLCPSCRYLLQVKSFSKDAKDDNKEQKRDAKRIINNKLDHYEVLGVHERAQAKEIKDAYIRLSKAYHPDVNKSPEAIEIFQQVSSAYETIGNYDNRRNYDRKMFGQQLQTNIRRSAASAFPSPFQRPSSGPSPSSASWRPKEDYTDDVYKDKLGKERVYRSKPSAEENISKSASEEEIFFNEKDDSMASTKRDMLASTAFHEKKALDMRRRVIKIIKNPAEEAITSQQNEGLLLPMLIMIVITGSLYVFHEINHIRKLIEEGDTYGDRLVQEKQRKLNDPDYEPKDVKVKFVNTTAFREMKKYTKD